ncbi:hypothetical protein M5K25_028404 [Dendrobium thyrsiflorum]|uniref:Uncharacterized protein n=1 Tax=Dendrobium thyrsiflorum TaxID=117978 RepID=A0ABD0TTC3_DENTH
MHARSCLALHEFGSRHAQVDGSCKPSGWMDRMGQVIQPATLLAAGCTKQETEQNFLGNLGRFIQMPDFGSQLNRDLTNWAEIENGFWTRFSKNYSKRKAELAVFKVVEESWTAHQLSFYATLAIGNGCIIVSLNIIYFSILHLLLDFQKMKSSTPRPSTSYRKKKAVKQELPEDIDLYQDPTTNLYYQGLDTAVPVLLVDGYNVCGYWTKLKKHFIKGRLDIARQKLTDELITFSVLKEPSKSGVKLTELPACMRPNMTSEIPKRELLACVWTGSYIQNDSFSRDRAFRERMSGMVASSLCACYFEGKGVQHVAFGLDVGGVSLAFEAREIDTSFSFEAKEEGREVSNT